MIQFCEMLEAPISGSLSTTETIQDTVVTFSCILGYVLSDEEPLVCLQNPAQIPGVWSADESTCSSKPQVVYASSKVYIRAYP